MCKFDITKKKKNLDQKEILSTQYKFRFQMSKKTSQIHRK